MSGNSGSLIPGSSGSLIPGPSPEAWVKRRITEYVIGAVAGFVGVVVGVIDGGFGIIEGGIGSAGDSLLDTLDLAVNSTEVGVQFWNGLLVDLATVFGPASAIVLVLLWALTFAVVVLLLVAFGPALSDALGAVPVIGSLADAIVTWLQEWLYRLIEFARGDD
ncbi:hypothetical protein ACFQJ5_16650 [Halomicroarcula sp. GCM10025324]|uniref:hypothetical protein n=1 Tax=Haloarcula TaxID=2237 RepID=UPI0023E89E43|nr:hypothetical protein [Halomicroarcula sp. ZS-22-S1]